MTQLLSFWLLVLFLARCFRHRSVVSHVGLCVVEERLSEKPTEKSIFPRLVRPQRARQEFLLQREEAEEDRHIHKCELVIYSPSSAHLRIRKIQTSPIPTFWQLVISLSEHQGGTFQHFATCKINWNKSNRLQMFWSDAPLGQVAASLGWLWGFEAVPFSWVPPEFGSPFPTNSPVDRAVKIQYYLLSLPKMWEQEPKHKSTPRQGAVRSSWSRQVGTATCCWARGSLSWPVTRGSSGCFVRVSDMETNQGLQWEPPWRHVHLLSPVTSMTFFPKTGRHQSLLLSRCFYPSAKVPSQQNCSHESVGKGNLGCEHLNSFNFLIWIMAYVSERRGRCRLPAAAAIIYNHHLGPFSITTTLMRTQGHLHLCQNTSGKSFTASNFLVRCALHLLILSVYVRRKKKSSCDFVKVWKEEMPAWAFLNFSRLFLCWHVDVCCSMKKAVNNWKDWHQFCYRWAPF